MPCTLCEQKDNAARAPGCRHLLPSLPAALPSPSRALALSRRRSNCEFREQETNKVRAEPPALPRCFPVRPQLSESCLQGGKELRRHRPSRGFGVSRQGNLPAAWGGVYFLGVREASYPSETPRGVRGGWVLCEQPNYRQAGGCGLIVSALGSVGRTAAVPRQESSSAASLRSTQARCLFYASRPLGLPALFLSSAQDR